MIKNNAVVAVHKSHAEPEAAVKQPPHSGFDMKRLSIPGRDDHRAENVVGYHDGEDRMEYWRKTGAFCGGIWGVVKNSFAQPDTALKTDKSAVIAHGSADISHHASIRGHTPRERNLGAGGHCEAFIHCTCFGVQPASGKQS